MKSTNVVQSEKVKKTELGQFFTNGSPFNNFQFNNWFKKALKVDNKVLEPFAGANNLVKMLAKNWKNCHFFSYDIDPKEPNVKKRDTLKNFPKNFKISITNPPWLAKNSATRKKLFFPNIKYDNLYKFCLERMLLNCEYVAAIIPATFIQTKLFFERLDSYTLLNRKIFLETENPVCLALFVPKKSNPKRTLYIENKKMGNYDEIIAQIKKSLKPNSELSTVKFNVKNGNLGILTVDSVKNKNIKFVEPQEIPNSKVKNTSRHIVRIYVSKKITKTKINELNKKLLQIRKKTNDLLFSPFKGLMKNGEYRRRITFSFIRKIILSTI